MLNVNFADCVTNATVINADCQLYWVSLMLSVSYKSFMLSVFMMDVIMLKVVVPMVLEPYLGEWLGFFNQALCS
jgi:hypothetical protein